MTSLVIPVHHPDPTGLAAAQWTYLDARNRYLKARELVADYPGNVREYRDATDELEEAERLFRRMLNA